MSVQDTPVPEDSSMTTTAAGPTMELIIGREVACSDGVCGDFRRVIVDPAVREVTHLAVEPKHGLAPGRLVPVELVEVTGDEMSLRCTVAEFQALEQADEVLFTPGSGGLGGYGQVFGFRTNSMSLATMGPGPQAVASDLVPTGDIEVSRGDHVHAKDGDIGRVQGIVVNSHDHRMTGVLLAEGHLWGQKRVLIPISAVTGVGDGVQLSLTKDEIKNLPSDEGH